MSSDDRRRRLAARLHAFSIHLLRRARAADRESGLSPERLSALSVLVFAGAKSVSELAAIEQVSAPAISRTAKALVAAGLARRGPADADQRRVLLTATDKGRRLVEAGRARRVAAVAAELDALGDPDIAALERAADVLAKLESRR